MSGGRAGRCQRARGGRGGGGAQGDATAPRQPLQALTADVVMLLPVFVLAEGATVTSCVAAAARLTGFPPTVPAALVRQWGEIKNKSLFVPKKERLSLLFKTKFEKSNLSYDRKMHIDNVEISESKSYFPVLYVF